MFNFNSFRDSFVHNPNFTFSQVRETLLIFKLVQTRYFSQKIQPRISFPKKSYRCPKFDGDAKQTLEIRVERNI